jgi:hypothetical protein
MKTARPAKLEEPVQETESKGWKDRAADVFRQIDWSIVGMALAIKALVFFAGWVSYQILLDKKPAGWLEIWHRWDALRYIRLADKGYGATGDPSDFVGFPLFPTLIRMVNLVVGDTLVSGFIVAGIASVAAAVLLHKLVQIDDKDSVARNSAWFMLIFPTAFYLHINYTEGLFLATAIGSFLFARKGNWKLAFAFGFLACMTRLHGLVLVPALMVEAFQQYRETRKWRMEWIFIAAIPLGFAVHLLINYNATGNAFAFLDIGSKHYHKALTPPWVGIPQTYYRMFSPGAEDGITNGTAELFFILLGLAGIVASAFWLRPAYTVWIALNWLIFTSTNFILSVPRYTLSLFPLFIIFAKLAERSFWYTVITTGSLLFLGIFLAQFVRGHWVFG